MNHPHTKTNPPPGSSPLHAAAAPLLAIALLITAATTALTTTEPTPANAQPLTDTHWLIDINSADATTLHLLPNIGPVLAQRIINQRPFTSPTDLQRVSGIGPKTAADLAPHATFNQ